MPENPKPEPLALFREKLSASLSADGGFVRLVLSTAQAAEGKPEKVLGRCIELRGAPHLSVTSRYSTRDEVKNLRLPAGIGWVLKRLESEFENALLCTTAADWQLCRAAGGDLRLVRHKPSQTTVPARQHDQAHASLLDAAARPWLSGLGVTDAQGRVRPGLSDKYSQIERYLEIFTHLTKDAHLERGEWAMADMGSGKGYLTFGLWHLLRRRWGWPVRVVGVETREDLVASSETLARKVGAEGLEFIRGDIQSTPLPEVRVFIALHACDTATDDAIRRGIDSSARLIIVAPCCHKQLRPHLHHPEALAAVLRHGIMEERMAEWVTDGLRALFLEWAGYRTKIFEFVSSEHTPKNLMIAAVRAGTAFADPGPRQQIEELKRLFGITHHALDDLLSRVPSRVQG